MAGELKQVFAGTTTTCVTRTSSLSNTANSADSDATALDNSTLLYPFARAVLDVPDGFAATPTAGAPVEIWALIEDVDGTNDEAPTPGSSNISTIGRYMGCFIIDNQASTRFRKATNISLEGIAKCRLYLKNSAGTTMQRSTADITLKVTPFSVMPAP